MKIAFYLDNSAIPETDFSEPEKGNPGVGAAEYLHVVIPYFMKNIAPQNYEFHIFAQHIKKMPHGFVLHKIESVVEAAEIAKKIGIDVFVFRPRIFEEHGILDVIEKLKLPSIGRAALTPHPKHARKMSKCQYFKALVCVGREQYDSLIDSPVSSKTVLINNGVSPKPFKESYHLGKDPYLVTYMGSLVPQKGFHVLAAAWPKVLARVPQAKLSVLGSAKVYSDSAELGPLGIASEDYERKYIMPYLLDADGRLNASVTFHGKVGHEKYEILRKSMVGVPNPTGQTETCCVSAVEFSASGTAIATGGYYALLDTVRHNQTGLLGRTTDDLADNICRLLLDPDRSIMLGVQGEKFVRENYSFDVIAPRWLHLCQSLNVSLPLVNKYPYKNISRHRKWLRIINSPFQRILGKLITWPSTQELEYFILTLLNKKDFLNMRLINKYARLANFSLPLLKRLGANKLAEAHLPMVKRTSKNGFITSVYNVKLKENWIDSTFRLAAAGLWGFKLHDLLRDVNHPFVFIDVGANFGAYSLMASKNNYCKAVYSIEPNPTVYELLLDNINENGVSDVVFPLKFGIAEISGEKEISYKDTHLGIANFRDSGSVKTKVDVKNYEAFDHIYEENSDIPVFIKIDVEGYEPEVIKQLVQSKLANNIKYLFIEISPKWVLEEEMKLMIDQIESLGLTITWRGKDSYQYDALYTK